MKWGFTISELRGTDVLTLEHRAFLGLLLPLHVGSATMATFSRQAPQRFLCWLQTGR